MKFKYSLFFYSGVEVTVYKFLEFFFIKINCELQRLDSRSSFWIRVIFTKSEKRQALLRILSNSFILYAISLVKWPISVALHNLSIPKWKTIENQKKKKKCVHIYSTTTDNFHISTFLSLCFFFRSTTEMWMQKKNSTQKWNSYLVQVNIAWLLNWGIILLNSKNKKTRKKKNNETK